MYISVVLSNDSCIALNLLSSASTFGRNHRACATTYLMSISYPESFASDALSKRTAPVKVSPAPSFA